MGLVGYDSSDDEDELAAAESQAPSPSIPANGDPTSDPKADRQTPAPGNAPLSTAAGQPGQQASTVSDSDRKLQALAQSASEIQPAALRSQTLDPFLPPATDLAIGPPLPELVFLPQGQDADADANANAGAEGDEAPKSPYSATRALLRDLTLPSVPNTNMPPSPPGSPPPSYAVLTRKVENLLALKRNEGQHFNARLAGSAGMRNPALADKLLAFAGLGTAGDDDAGTPVDQYATVLSPDAGWDPAALPAWAYWRPLRQSQERLRKVRERARGEAVDFVAGSTSAEEVASPGQAQQTTSLAPVLGKRKTRFGD